MDVHGFFGGGLPAYRPLIACVRWGWSSLPLQLADTLLNVADAAKHLPALVLDVGVKNLQLFSDIFNPCGEPDNGFSRFIVAP